ncbi:MAG: SDR family oxidoreductase [Myxococcales bacterium]|nr:SDR family oxidoreductase [Myxococcales bacterium]
MTIPGTTDPTAAAGLLAGRRILVTGGSGGLGAGICGVLAREGARVAFTWHRDADGAARTAAACGPEALCIQADLRDPAAPGRVVEAVEAAFGGLDALVNNAAFSEAVPFILLDDAELDELMQLNLFAPMRLARAALRPMIRQKHGRIVNVSSFVGSRTLPGPVHYAASKGGLEGFTRSLAHEAGPYGVLVNAVAAGIFEGGLKHTIPAHHQARYLQACALGRFGRPEECGELVAWLCSDRNTYTQGAVIVQDGGTTG